MRGLRSPLSRSDGDATEHLVTARINAFSAADVRLDITPSRGSLRAESLRAHIEASQAMRAYGKRNDRENGALSARTVARVFYRLRRVRTVSGMLVAAFATVIMPAVARPHDMPTGVRSAPDGTRVKSLSCFFGSVGVTPYPLPPGYETQFAKAVVEITSPRAKRNLAVSNFVLFDPTGKETKFKRVVDVQAEARNPANGTRPWDGTLPVGRIRLQIRVALLADPGYPVRFRLTVGQYVIEGKVDGSWPT
jgi:hypothetical protein